MPSCCKFFAHYGAEKTHFFQKQEISAPQWEAPKTKLFFEAPRTPIPRPKIAVHFPTKVARDHCDQKTSVKRYKTYFYPFFTSKPRKKSFPSLPLRRKKFLKGNLFSPSFSAYSAPYCFSEFFSFFAFISNKLTNLNFHFFTVLAQKLKKNLKNQKTTFGLYEFPYVIT